MFLPQTHGLPPPPPPPTLPPPPPHIHKNNKKPTTTKTKHCEYENMIQFATNTTPTNLNIFYSQEKDWAFDYPNYYSYHTFTIRGYSFKFGSDMLPVTVAIQLRLCIFGVMRLFNCTCFYNAAPWIAECSQYHGAAGCAVTDLMQVFMIAFSLDTGCSVPKCLQSSL